VSKAGGLPRGGDIFEVGHHRGVLSVMEKPHTTIEAVKEHSLFGKGEKFSR